MFASLFRSTHEKHLAQAIVKGDAQKVRHHLERGARKIDYLFMVPDLSAWARPGDQVPAQRFHDPVALAHYVGSGQDVMKALADYGLTPKPPLVHGSARPSP